MSITAELAKAAFLQASLQIARRDYADHARANGYSIRQQISREECAESTILFNDDYAAAFGVGDRDAMRAGLESTGA
jgi:hypothetical protein